MRGTVKMDEEPCRALQVALRVYTTRSRRGGGRWPEEAPGASPGLKRRIPHEALVFDTETTLEPCQRLLVGGWRFYRDAADGEPGTTCIEEGLFYPDDLPEREPAQFEDLVRYAGLHASQAAAGYTRMGSTGTVELWPVSRWLEERLFLYGVNHRDRCDVVGFNLLFDFGRLARHWGHATKYYLGGFSLGFWGGHDARGVWRDLKYHPRLLVKAIDPRRTLFGWGNLKRGDSDEQRPARMVDLRTLAFALTDQAHTLESACAAFGDPFKKAEVDYGVISEPLLDYLREDVEHTAILYARCQAELRRHEGIALRPHALYSPATVGTRYLEAMGLERPSRKFRSVSNEMHGRAMSAFYGGRAEARIVRVPVPVAHVDATAMYPTVNALLKTWDLVRAANVAVVDATQEVRALLAESDLFDRCFERSFWGERIGVTVVELTDPDGLVLPVRGFYDPRSPDPGIGLNPLSYEGRLWYLLPDVIGAVLLSGGRMPTVSRAVRLRPVGVQAGLASVRLRGGRQVNPACEDPFVAMVEERHRVRRDRELPKAERDRLEHFLKITANATAYGTLARFDRRELASEVEVTVYGPDDELTKAKTKYPEDPGPFCFPPVAATLTSGARLMLAMLERLVTDAGGTYAFCDTDAMAIVASEDPTPIECPTPDGSGEIRPLSPDTVRRLLRRFDDLNPYNRSVVKSLWKGEHDSLRHPITCYAISAKRYALYREGATGPEPLQIIDAPEQATFDEVEPDETGLVDWSESGLGMYLDPRDPEKPARDAEGRRLWINEAWEWVLAGDPRASLPGWAGASALTRFGVSGPRIQRWFAGFDASVEREVRIRPGTFGLIAHPDGFSPLEPESRPLPTAAYEADPEKWPSLNWYDRRTGRRIAVTTASPDRNAEAYRRAVAHGGVRIRTVGDVVGTYRMRVEHKSLAPDGARVHHDTRGLLQRRPVESARVLTDLAGKEANKIVERLSGEVFSVEEYWNDYGLRADRMKTLIVPVLRMIQRERGFATLKRWTGRGRSAVYAALGGQTLEQCAYLDVAVEYATGQLESAGIRLATGPYATLFCYLRFLGVGSDSRRCASCGGPMSSGARTNAKFCSDACRQRAWRHAPHKGKPQGSDRDGPSA